MTRTSSATVPQVARLSAAPHDSVHVSEPPPHAPTTPVGCRPSGLRYRWFGTARGRSQSVGATNPETTRLMVSRYFSHVFALSKSMSNR